MANTQPNAVADLGIASKIPTKILDNLVEKLNLCIGSEIHDAMLNGEQSVVIGIGIGTLSVNLSDMQCKFVPGKELKAAIKQSLSEGVDPLELAMEQALSEKLIAICDEEL